MFGIVINRLPELAVLEQTAASTDARANARPVPVRFVALAGQLALLLIVFRVFRVEETGVGDPGFFFMASLAFGAFAVHYWLPFCLKEPFWIAVSLAAPAFLFEWRVAAALLLAGGALYLLLNSRLAYWWRVGVLAAAFAAAMLVRYHGGDLRRVLGVFYIPESLWPVLGSIFMFRAIIYVHDVRRMSGRLPLKEYLAYFFILPNYYFQLFPVIDYQTMRLSYYRADIHAVAQKGIRWIARGTLHLLAYRALCYVRDTQRVEDISSPWKLLGYMFLTYLLYLRVSGQFHICVGMLHLFGYDLPETNRRYLLARSFTDFWRRINIYWKDFMVKVVYFPVWFRLRKRGTRFAMAAATASVFLVTWALHACQSLWLSGGFGVRWPDTIFWTALAALVMVNVLLESRKPRRREVKGWRSRVLGAASVIGTLFLIMTLWSLWSAPTLGAWLRLVKQGVGLNS